MSLLKTMNLFLPSSFFHSLQNLKRMIGLFKWKIEICFLLLYLLFTFLENYVFIMNMRILKSLIPTYFATIISSSHLYNEKQGKT